MSTIVAKRFPFIRCLQEKSAGAKSSEYCGWGMIMVLFLAKHQCVGCCVIMVQNLWLVFPQFCPFPKNCFAQSAPNFKLVFLIDRTTRTVVFSSGKRKISAGVNCSKYGGWGITTVLFLSKNSRTSIDVWCWCVIMMQNSWLVFPQFCTFPTNYFAQAAHNFKVVFLIDRTTRTVARIHDAPHHCNRRKQWAKPSHLTEFDVLFWTLALGW